MNPPNTRDPTIRPMAYPVNKSPLPERSVLWTTSPSASRVRLAWNGRPTRLDLGAPADNLRAVTAAVGDARPGPSGDWGDEEFRHHMLRPSHLCVPDSAGGGRSQPGAHSYHPGVSRRPEEGPPLWVVELVVPRVVPSPTAGGGGGPVGGYGPHLDRPHCVGRPDGPSGQARGAQRGGGMCAKAERCILEECGLGRISTLIFRMFAYVQQ